MTCRMDNSLGAYVLDALEPDETRTVQAHLTGCEACREEVSSLAATTSLLALLTLQDIEQLYDPEPGDHVPTLARLRHRRAALAGAVAVLIAATAIGGVPVFRGSSGSTPPGIVRVVDPTTHVRAAVTMTARSWGTQLRLSLTGAYPNGWCSLVVHSSSGRSDVAATWLADAKGAAGVGGATDIPAGRLAELDVVTATGTRLVRIKLPGHGN